MSESWHVPWETLSSRLVYRNPWLAVREDRVRLPNGRATIYGVVSCGDCVGILPFLDPETVLMVRQYRYVARKVTWEMPTGGVRDGESLEDAARRELAEESGYRAGILEPLTRYHTSKSVVEETAHLFVARNLSQIASSANGDETEFIDVQAVPFDHVRTMVLDGTITDSMTIVAVLHASLGATSQPVSPQPTLEADAWLQRPDPAG